MVSSQSWAVWGSSSSPSASPGRTLSRPRIPASVREPTPHTPGNHPTFNLVAVAGASKIIDFIRNAGRAGVILHVCQPALPEYRIDRSADITREADHVSRASVLAILIPRCDKLNTF